mmetsp:Transcript_104417/g.239135  ORF Transcript_104417/g.239135 Transcript_104417/m.239135 type:complete len:168 (+) Transcript_104417:1175-1678(+)
MPGRRDAGSPPVAPRPPMRSSWVDLAAVRSPSPRPARVDGRPRGRETPGFRCEITIDVDDDVFGKRRQPSHPGEPAAKRWRAAQGRDAGSADVVETHRAATKGRGAGRAERHVVEAQCVEASETEEDVVETGARNPGAGVAPVSLSASEDNEDSEDEKDASLRPQRG